MSVRTLQLVLKYPSLGDQQAWRMLEQFGSAGACRSVSGANRRIAPQPASPGQPDSLHREHSDASHNGTTATAATKSCRDSSARMRRCPTRKPARR